jgi:endonuclease/exonuclease/phosphatase family metal-dependent hydrolase
VSTLRLISWNLDGLDTRYIDQRTEAACRIILERVPDVVFLQEVTRRSFFAHIRPWMQGVGYHASPPNLTSKSSYGCMMFTRPPIEVRSTTREPFATTQMGRSLIRTTVRWGGHELLLLTAHLESLRDGAPERIQQRDVVLDALASHNGPAVFAGDTNLRDSEVAGLDIRDAWELLGAPPQTRFTFDTLTIPNKRGRNRARYDRVFLNDHPGWRPTGLFFLGMEAVPGTGGLFPSDHAGLEILLSKE